MPIETDSLSDGPCHHCGSPTDSLAGDPGRWPLIFPADDGTGVCRYWHVECVMGRMKDAAQLRERIEKYDTISTCACCGVKLAWIYAGDGTHCREALTGEPHKCPVTREDFAAGKFPEGTYRFQEARAIAAEAEVARLKDDAQLRKGGAS